MFVFFDWTSDVKFEELLLTDSEFTDSSLLNTALYVWADTDVLRVYAHTVT